MAKSWREIGSTVWHYSQRALPLAVSLGLVVWLVFFKVGTAKLVDSVQQVNWPLLLGISFIQLVVLFLWDSFSLWWLYSQPNKKLPFKAVLSASTEAAGWSAINLEVGQAAFAVRMANMVDEPVATFLGRSIVMSMFDFGVTTAFGLLGYILMPTRRYRYLMYICIVGVGGLILLALAVAYLFPQRWRTWIQKHPWGRWLKWWSWKHTGLLLVQRVVLATGIFAYAGAGLALIGVPPHPTVADEARMVFGVIPFVLLSEAIPSAGGLGTRETVLIYLTGGPPGAILGFSLIWSVSLIIGRILIGTGSWIYTSVTGKSKEEDFESDTSKSNKDQSAAGEAKEKQAS
ncbi:MAG TPA: lysylphosphatidylglycerol synthase transmembrane domain-containing protein [Gemmataceae bacterium]|nr:lysylphosphatidylglycerol synthase transmembrane domain-containing protein [Gemmataceae bacterium]